MGASVAADISTLKASQQATTSTLAKVTDCEAAGKNYDGSTGSCAAKPFDVFRSLNTTERPQCNSGSIGA